MNKRVFLPFFLFLSSCASTKMDVIQVGPWFNPVKVSKVELFNSRDKVKKPFGAIAILHSERYFCSPKEDEKQIAAAAAKAAKTGADGVVYSIVEYDRSLNPDLPQECYLSGMAIKYVNPRQMEKKEQPDMQWSPI